MYGEKTQSFEKAIKSSTRAARAANPGEDLQTYAAPMWAGNILAADLGRYSDLPPEYNLDEATRDRLIAHTRQEVAHALLNTERLISDVQSLARLVRTGVVILVALFVVFLLLTFWPPFTWWHQPYFERWGQQR
jgi:hypothetical protein